MPERTPPDVLRHINFRGTQRAPAIARRPLRSVALAPARHEAPEDRISPFITWSLNQIGLDASSYRARPLERRLPACFRALRVASEDAARRKLERHPELVPVAVNALMLGVTEFFRDPDVFATLRGILDLLSRARGPLRIWSVSCSSGCELFSVGLILADQGHLAGCRLLGTDCRAEALDHARRASYSEAEVAKIPMDLRSVHFERAGERLRVREPLRSQPEWRLEDAVREEISATWDVVLWRNAAIYMKPPVAEVVWNRLAASLRPGGVLVTGNAERPTFAPRMQRVAACIYSRVPE